MTTELKGIRSAQHVIGLHPARPVPHRPDYLDSARASHARYVEPTRVYADLILRGDGDCARTSTFVAEFILARLSRAGSYSLRLHERCKFLAYEDVSKVLQDTARYAGYMEAKVIYQVAQSCKKQ